MQTAPADPFSHKKKMKTNNLGLLKHTTDTRSVFRIGIHCLAHSLAVGNLLAGTEIAFPGLGADHGQLLLCAWQSGMRASRWGLWTEDRVEEGIEVPVRCQGMCIFAIDVFGLQLLNKVESEAYIQQSLNGPIQRLSL